MNATKAEAAKILFNVWGRMFPGTPAQRSARKAVFFEFKKLEKEAVLERSIWTHPRGKTEKEFAPMKLKRVVSVSSEGTIVKMSDGEEWFLDELRDAGWKRKK